MILRTTLTAIVLSGILFTSPAEAQIDIYGQISPAFVQSSDAIPQVTINNGRPTFQWRLDVLTDAYITERITAYINIRSYQDQIINIDYLAIRIADISPIGFSIQAGKFDMPFGNLYARRFPANNFLLDLPLIYRYHTVIMSDYLFPNKETMIENRGLGGSDILPSSMRVLDSGLYDTGVMIFGSVGIVDYFAALMNGTVSSTGSYGNSLNINSSLGKLIRMTVTPLFGLTIGGSFNWGNYLAEDVQGYFPENSSPQEYRQYSASIDVEYSRGHVQVFGQALYNTWEYPFNPKTNLDVFGYYAEMKYTFRPRWFIAGRINQLLFSDMSIGNTDQRWDHDITEIETGIGFSVDRNTLVKAVYRETILYGTRRISNSAFGLQMVARF